MSISFRGVPLRVVASTSCTAAPIVNENLASIPVLKTRTLRFLVREELKSINQSPANC